MHHDEPWIPDSLSRRELFRAGLCGAAGLAASGPLGALGPGRYRGGKARSVIQIWMWGGPAHLDTFDPKPGAGYDFCGPLNKAIATNVDGIRIGQSLPLLARMADKYAILRGMTHGVNGHETASYMVQTGRKAGGRVTFPSVGAVVSRFRGYGAGYKGLIPPYIVLTRPQGRFSEAGFLGSRYKPFATGGNPAAYRFLVEGVASPGITRERQASRRKLLQRLDGLRKALKDDPRVRDFVKAEEQAYDLILGNAGKVFDLNTEKREVRERYGRTTFGQSCLMARRLVEQGVPYITINYPGWDTHKEHFQAMRRRLPELDRGLSALLADLEGRKLLDSTIVWWGGEFGRTPKVDWQPPWNGGRGHFGHAFSSVVAGGGFKGGRVVGATDDHGAQVVKRPVYPWDLITSLYAQLGINPAAELRHPQGQMIRITPGQDDGYKSAGPLQELT